MKALVTLSAITLSVFASQAFASGAAGVSACFGTEPFWSLKLTDKTIQFKLSGDESETKTIAKPTARSASGRSSEWLALFQGQTKEKAGRFLNVLVKQAECSDGMSDELYPYSVEVLSGTSLYTGCCRSPESK